MADRLAAGTMADSASTTLTKIPVRSLRTGSSSIIVGIHAEHLSAKRLADMGFVPGARVRMVRRGNPCIVGIGGTFVGLGGANQNCVLVDSAVTDAEEVVEPDRTQS